MCASDLTVEPGLARAAVPDRFVRGLTVPVIVALPTHPVDIGRRDVSELGPVRDLASTTRILRKRRNWDTTLRAKQTPLRPAL